MIPAPDFTSSRLRGQQSILTLLKHLRCALCYDLTPASRPRGPYCPSGRSRSTPHIGIGAPAVYVTRGRARLLYVSERCGTSVCRFGDLNIVSAGLCDSRLKEGSFDRHFVWQRSGRYEGRTGIRMGTRIRRSKRQGKSRVNEHPGLQAAFDNCWHCCPLIARGPIERPKPGGIYYKRVKTVRRCLGTCQGSIVLADSGSRL
jgi:hypothetical protein